MDDEGLKTEYYVLYGSQTGNSESIARDFHTKLQEHGVPSSCLTLNESKKISLKESAKAVIIICSTTGNGDAPENADSWWRSNKVRALVSPVKRSCSPVVHENFV